MNSSGKPWAGFSPNCVSCCKALEQAGAARCIACESPQRGIALLFFKYEAIFELIKATLLAILIPLAIFGATHLYTQGVEQRKKEKEKVDQVLGTLSDAKIALAGLYQPCFESGEKCRAATDERLTSYRSHVARFGLAVNRYEPDFDPSIELLTVTGGAAAEELRQIWADFSGCLDKGGNALTCDENRRRSPLLHLQTAKFVMDYLACAVESRFAAKTGAQMSTRCWAIITERQAICFDRPAEMVKDFADAVENGGVQGMYRMPFDEVMDDIIKNYLLPGSGLE